MSVCVKLLEDWCLKVVPSHIHKLHCLQLFIEPVGKDFFHGCLAYHSGLFKLHRCLDRWQAGTLVTSKWLAIGDTHWRRDCWIPGRCHPGFVYVEIVLASSPRFHNLLHSVFCPVGWGCKIHWMHLCRGARHPPRNEWPGVVAPDRALSIG